MERRDLEPYLKGEKFETSAGGWSEIHHVENNPDYISKRIRFDFDSGYMTLEKRKKELEQTIDLVKKYMSDFVPNFHLVYSHGDENKETPYIFMEKVEPEQVLEEKDIQNAINQLDEFFTRLSKIYQETYQHGHGTVLDFWRLTNYVYGKTKNDENPRLYFVDLYPVEKEGRGYIRDLIWALINDDEVMINDKTFFYKDFPNVAHNFPKGMKTIEKLGEI
jgi:hypothetical protein